MSEKPGLPEILERRVLISIIAEAARFPPEIVLRDRAPFGSADSAQGWALGFTLWNHFHFLVGRVTNRARLRSPLYCTTPRLVGDCM